MHIDLNNAKKLQTLYGWGTSACWWSQYCKNGKTQNDIAKLLYSKDGLNLNIYRYNIGGGTDDNNYRVNNPWRRTESFMQYDAESEQTTWDFSKDAAAVTMMKKCLSLGNIDTLILFCNSPHYSLTSTGQASGSLLYHTCNIPKMNYYKFADYVLTVAQHFIDEGLPVKYISPINEPQWKWGGSYVWQEGCHYEVDEIVEVLHIFASEIIKRKMDIKLYGPETGEMLNDTYKYIEAISKDETICKVMDIFAYHSYHADDKPEDRYIFKRDIVNKYPQYRFDMSEWCELPNKSHSDNFNGALIMARIIGQDLIYAGAQSWTEWVAINQISIKDDGNDYGDGVISASDDFSTWHINKRYYGFAHFSKYIPVGSIALDIDLHPTNENNTINAFAFDNGGKKIVIIVNEGEEQNITLDYNASNMQIIESTAEYQLKEIYNGTFTKNIVCKQNSILTVVC